MSQIKKNTVQSLNNRVDQAKERTYEDRSFEINHSD
jgi:hypothetical protein